ncbi:C40 family peptidase [Marinomonas ostreistagni]|uniref:C40 family peptidase n=1 Tax=Marinomonas ostreistagni TaxID=359209 RepID=UPI001951175D|nr:NlpC/P60 family protein [Marinomonas ostreistagni]MBM6550909.1 C40 family peptidase [Marinomonas ostreistagni]
MTRANTFLTATLMSLSLTLTGCGSMMQSAPDTAYQVEASVLQKSSEAFVSQRLYQQHQEWRGTPYVWGGMSKRGVDCSGFVHLTLEQQFATRIPRTTAQQSQTGFAIPSADLRAGDLVFFKTGSKARHVGIYIEDGQFLHASSSRGVMISRLDNVYWKEHYWHARRLHP